MSQITNLIIAASLAEDKDYLKKKFSLFTYNGVPFDLVSVNDDILPDGWYGGSKYLGINLFIGAYNFLPINDLVSFMRTQIIWDSPGLVQLLIKEQDDDGFRIIDIFP